MLIDGWDVRYLLSINQSANTVVKHLESFREEMIQESDVLEKFRKDELYLDAILYNLGVISISIGKLTEVAKAKFLNLDRHATSMFAVINNSEDGFLNLIDEIDDLDDEDNFFSKEIKMFSHPQFLEEMYDYLNSNEFHFNRMDIEKFIRWINNEGKIIAWIWISALTKNPELNYITKKTLIEGWEYHDEQISNKNLSILTVWEKFEDLRIVDYRKAIECSFVKDEPKAKNKLPYLL
jgi:hypothetical protein